MRNAGELYSWWNGAIIRARLVGAGVVGLFQLEAAPRAILDRRIGGQGSGVAAERTSAFGAERDKGS